MSKSTTDESGPLLGAADIRELAAALGVRPTKQRGQNFVIDANTVRRIVRTAEVRPDDVVVEIGPGLGSLTLGLLEAADRVTAVEIDEVLAAALPSTVAARMPDRADRFALVHRDAMHVTELPGPAPTALVANLPYNVAVPVLLHMLATFPTIDRTLVMVQSEVADRLAARPGNKVYGVPSVKANWYAEVKRASTPSAATSSGPRPTSTPAWSPSYAATSRSRPRRAATRSSPSSTRPSPSAARRCGPRCRGGPDRPPPRRPRWSPRVSRRRPAARR